MQTQTIKFIIAQDGTVREEVQGVKGGECTDVTLPFEEALGNLETRQFKTEYYVASQHNQNETKQEATVDTGTSSNGSTS